MPEPNADAQNTVENTDIDFDTDFLLAELELVPYSERVRRMVVLGQASRDEAHAQAVIETLAKRDGFYERLLVLHSCRGSQNGARILTALGDASRMVRNFAVKLVPAVCTNDEITKALESVSHKTRLVLLRGLWKHKRQAAIGPFLQAAARRNDSHLNELLPFGPIDSVRQFLPTDLPRFGAPDWTRLARFHPDVAHETLMVQTEALTEADPRLLRDANAVLPLLSKSRPGKALALVQAVLRFEPPSRVSLQNLTFYRASELADLLLQTEDGEAARVDLSRAAHRLSQSQLWALIAHRPALLPQRGVWLKRLSPDLRQAAYQIAGLGWRNSEGVLDAPTVALLPAPARQAEARRCFRLPALATRPASRLPYAAFLPWDEARTLLQPFIQNPDADLRASALAALIGAARYEPARLPDVLGLLRSRNNEQDPVRRALLAAASNLPPSRWQAAQLDDIGQILSDALGASDLSPVTSGEAEKLIVALFPFHTEWSALWLGKWVESRGNLTFHRLGDRLTNGEVARIAPALLPVLQAWETRERERFLVQFARSLGRRLRVFDGLVDILERVVFSTRQSYLASEILTLLTEHRPDRMAALIPALLQSDPSTILVPAVHLFLHRKRQELLTPFLGQSAYAGRFGTGKTRFVLPIASGFFRWVPAQQERFAQTLSDVTGDRAQGMPAVFQAINQLAALPAVAPTRLVALASQSEQTAVRDAALHALARRDNGDGVQTLVSALGDQRARIAIYALRSALLEMPAARALDILQAAPTEKVTVAKEVIRLLGELDTPDVFPLLLDMDARPLHRDARVALLRALWDHVENTQTWPILFRAARDVDASIASGVVRVPAERATPGVLQNLLRLLADLLAHTDVKVRLDTLNRCALLPIADSDRILLPGLLSRLASPLPDERAAAARAVFATYGTHPRDAEAVGKAIEAVRADRHALSTALSALQTALRGEGRKRLLPAVRAVLSALETDIHTTRLRAELAIAGLPWPDVSAYFMGLAATNALDAETLMASVRAIESSIAPRFSSVLAAFLAGSTMESDARRHAAQEGLSELEALLGASGDERLRRLALAAIVAQANGTFGWTDTLRARVEAYRSDPSVLVASAAQFLVLPPQETESQPPPG